MERTPSILLVEDEALIAIHLVDILEEAGLPTHHSHSGSDALAALTSGGHYFCGVVTDIQLGNGPNGWEVARKARELNPGIPTVYVSGDSAHEHTIYGVPESLMIQKPFAPAQLVIAISTLLNAAPSPERPTG